MLPRHSFYSALWKKVLEPAYEFSRGKQLPRIERFISKSQYFPKDQLEDLQWEKLAGLLEHAKSNVPFYSRFFKQNGLGVEDICRSRNLEPLPIITRQELMANPEDFISSKTPAGTYKKATGGSSGEPLRFLVCGQSDQWRVAMSRRGYGWAGAVNGRRHMLLWSGDIYEKPFSAKLKHGLHQNLIRQKHFINFNLSPKRLEQLCKLTDRHRPEVMICYTTSAEVFAQYVLDTGWRPGHPLEAVIVGAEKLYDTQRATIEDAFGCKVFESYGSREFMLIAMECDQHEGLHVSSENLMVEIVDGGKPAPPGQSGRVVITDLHNYAQPFIRYQNEDLATWSAEDCPCGRKLPLLKSIEGRVLDIIRGIDGRPLTGVFFPHLLKEYPAIRRFQVVQKKRDALEIRLISNGELDAYTIDQIEKQTLKVLPGMKLEIVQVEKLETNQSGKTRVTIGLPPD